MDVKSNLNDKLKNLLFLPINNGTKVGNYKISENIYLPIKAEDMIEEIKRGESFEKIPFFYFIEGMFYVLGADENFKYNPMYNKILNDFEESLKYIKGNIYEKISAENYEDAYILLKGLFSVEKTEENLEKLLIVCDKLRTIDNGFEDEELNIIENAKEIDEFVIIYLYESIIYRDKKDFMKALNLLNRYISLGGKETPDITEYKESLKNINDYEKGVELIYEDPKEALKILLPLTKLYGDSAEIFYYIAISYRNLEMFEKAIYYLNEAATIDDALIEVLNEYGINYASLGDYKTAVEYLDKAFKGSRSIEICTNIVMCYLNLNDIKQAKKYLEIAESIDSEDEIVSQIRDIIKEAEKQK